MPLTDTQIKQAKSQAKAYKMSDGGGLFLLITPKGGKWWRLKYRFEGKEKLLSMGTYPEVALKDARNRRDEARKQLATGIDPGENRKAVKLARVEKNGNTFEIIAREWLLRQSAIWSPIHLCIPGVRNDGGLRKVGDRNVRTTPTLT